MDSQEVVGVVVANSKEFVEEILRCQADGQISVPLRRVDDTERRAATRVSRVVEPGATTGFFRCRYRAGPSDRVAQIQFTSGTTGAAQGIVLTEGNIENTVQRLIQATGIDSSIREYVGVPVYYSFGMGRVRAVSSVGGEVFLPPTGFDPSELGGLLARGEINALSVVPTLVRLLLENQDQIGAHGGRMRFIEIGSQHMLRSEKEALVRLFPNASIVQHYGLTEASRTTFLKIHETEGRRLESVGQPAAPVEVEVGLDERIRIRGPNVAARRYSGGSFAPLTDDAAWLVTNDLGRVEDGFLYFNGRADDLVNCGGVKIPPESFEQRLFVDLGRSEGIAVGRLPDPLRGEGLLVAYTDASSISEEALRKAATRAAEGFGLKAAGAITVRRVAAIPRTETGKVRRQALAEEHAVASSSQPAVARAAVAAAEPLSKGAADVSPAELEVQLLGIWRETLGLKELSATDSFYDVGGDSLTAVAVALRMERVGIDRKVARGIFEGKSVRDLVLELRPALPALSAGTEAAGHALEEAPAAPVAAKSTLAALNEASNFLRGVVIIAMICSHWLPVYIASGGPAVQRLSRVLHPFFSMGSPTLAIVFGVGVSLFYSRQYARNRPAFFANTRTGVALLVGGALLYAAIELVSLSVQGNQIGLGAIILSLYGPLIYYAVATASLPLWIRYVSSTGLTVRRLAYVSLALYFSYLVLADVLPATGQTPGAEFVLRLLVGKWGLPQMASLSLFGVALGIVVERRLEQTPDLGQFVHPGVLLAAGGVLLSLAAGQGRLWFHFPKNSDLWSIVSYAGLLIFLLGAYGRYWTRLRSNVVARLAVEFVCCLGVLLFPLFVVQSMVYHCSVIVMTLTGLHHTIALTACIAVVVALASYPVYRVHRLYYA